MHVMAIINKFLWFLKNFVDFSYPFVVAVADKNGFKVSAVIVHETKMFKLLKIHFNIEHTKKINLIKFH